MISTNLQIAIVLGVLAFGGFFFYNFVTDLSNEKYEEGNENYEKAVKERMEELDLLHDYGVKLTANRLDILR